MKLLRLLWMVSGIVTILFGRQVLSLMSGLTLLFLGMLGPSRANK